MANSKFEYVRLFEREDYLLPNTWIVVRIDGRGFHKLSHHYGFTKPNDIRALNLMNAAAKHTLHVLPDIVLAYGQSDEYSFVFHKTCTLFERRASKLASTVVSTFTSAYIHLWPEHMSTNPVRGTYFEPSVSAHPEGATTPELAADLQTIPVPTPDLAKTSLDIGLLPSFDSRCVCYPSDTNIRDYLGWRQADCHINNLYNTTFWALIIKGGMTNAEAEDALRGTYSSDKNEILWSRFATNYNNELEMFKKGSVVLRNYALVETSESGSSQLRGDDQNQELSKTQREKQRKARQKAEIIVMHVDIIKDEFWQMRPWLLNGQPGRPIVSES